MSPLVVIEVSGPGASAAHGAEMVAACTASLRKGTCVLVEPNGAPTRAPDALAEVTAESELRFELRVAPVTDGRGRAPPSMRLLEFREVNAPEERWRSVGIAIASATSELALGGENGSADAKRAKAATTRADEHDARPFRLAGGMLSGSGMESGRMRLGGWLGSAFRFGKHGPYALALGRFATAPAGRVGGEIEPAEITASYMTLGLGGGLSPAAPGGVGIRVQAAAVAERFRATAVGTDGSQMAADERWLPGGLLGVEATWPESGAVGAVLGGNVEALSDATELTVNGDTLGKSESVRFSLFFGLELRP